MKPDRKARAAGETGTGRRWESAFASRICARSTTRRRRWRRAGPASPWGGALRAARKEKKKFEVVALDGISLEIRAGEVFGLLGPNGAGKSTTIGVLTTRTSPPAGAPSSASTTSGKEQVKAKRLIGVVPQRPNLDFALTAREILLFHGAYFGQSARERERRAGELLEKFKLTDRADHMVRTFSGGMMQRLSIARAMMHDPEVLFLDEPSAGLDPQTRLLLWEIIRDYNRLGKTIVSPPTTWTRPTPCATAWPSSTTAASSPRARRQELKASIPGGYLLRLRFDRVPDQLMAELKKLPGVTEVRSADRIAADVYADRGGPLIPPSSTRRRRRASNCATCTSPSPASRPVPASHRKEFARLNWKTFYALLSRDGHVARRNLLPMLLQNLLQPLLFTSSSSAAS
jgi:ABC-2 type transport system ATP-binding protein